MPINNSYNEDAIVEAIATALDNFYMNLIKKVDSLNVAAMKFCSCFLRLSALKTLVPDFTATA